jgi:tetratricopeptide (TPR) repeat protein
MQEQTNRSRAQGGAALLRGVVIFLFAAVPLTASAQSCGPPTDPVVIAAARARKEGRPTEAERMLWDARQATEQSAPDDPKMALYLRNTAGMHGTDAVAALQRAMDIDRRSFGPQNCAVAQDLYALALAYRPNQPFESERLLKEVIDMLHDTPAELGLKSNVSAQLAELYRGQGRLGEAIEVYEQAVKGCDAAKPITGTCNLFRSELESLYLQAGRTEDANRLRPGSEDPEGWQLDELDRQGREYETNGLYVKAEETYRRTIAFIQQHPERLFGILGAHFDMLGQVLEKEGRDTEAEEAYLRGLEVEEKAAGPKPPQSRYIQFLNFAPLMDLYRRKGRLQEMEAIIQRGLEIQEKYLSPQDRGIANTLGILANLYREEEKFAGAKPICERVLAAAEKNGGQDDPALLPILAVYAGVLRDLHDDTRLAAVQARINLLQLIQ